MTGAGVDAIGSRWTRSRRRSSSPLLLDLTSIARCSARRFVLGLVVRSSGRTCPGARAGSTAAEVPVRDRSHGRPSSTKRQWSTREVAAGFACPTARSRSGAGLRGLERSGGRARARSSSRARGSSDLRPAGNPRSTRCREGPRALEATRRSASCIREVLQILRGLRCSTRIRRPGAGGPNALDASTRSGRGPVAGAHPGRRTPPWIHAFAIATVQSTWGWRTCSRSRGCTHRSWPRIAPLAVPLAATRTAGTGLRDSGPGRDGSLLAGGGAVAGPGGRAWRPGGSSRARRGRRSAVADGLDRRDRPLPNSPCRPHLLCGIGWWLSYVGHPRRGEVGSPAGRAHGLARSPRSPISMAAQPRDTAVGSSMPSGSSTPLAPVTLLVVGPGVRRSALVIGFFRASRWARSFHRSCGVDGPVGDRVRVTSSVSP